MRSGVGRADELINDIRSSILSGKLTVEQALKTVTVNVAKVLKLYPKKVLLDREVMRTYLSLEKKT